MHKERIIAVKNGFDKFLLSDYFIVFVALVVFFSHALGNPHPGIIFFIAITIYTLLTQKDLLPIIPILLMVSYILPIDFMNKPHTDYLYLAIVFPIPVIASAVFYFVKNKPKFQKSSCFYPCLFFCAALTLSGAFTRFYLNATNVLMVVQMLGSYLFSCVLFFNTTSRLNFKYIAKSMVYAGVLVALQLGLFYIKSDMSVDDIVINKAISLGWGISNNIGITLGICLPASFYLATRSKYGHLYIITAFIMYVANLFTLSRGSIFICTVLLPFMLVLLVLQTPKTERIKTFTTLAVCAVVTVIFFFISKKEIMLVIERLADLGLKENGRFEIWEEAVEVFKKHPIFGVGFGYKDSFFEGHIMYEVHNTVLQFLASGGIICLITAMVFFIARYRLFLPLRREYIFFIVAVLIYEAYGMIDLTPFCPYLSFMVSMIFVAIEKDRIKELENVRLKALQKKKSSAPIPSGV